LKSLYSVIVVKQSFRFFNDLKAMISPFLKEPNLELNLFTITFAPIGYLLLMGSRICRGWNI